MVHFGALLLLLAIVLFWTLSPFMQHAVDRTVGFWIFWGIIETALIAFVIGVFLKKK